jgi:hypothetical protein
MTTGRRTQAREEGLVYGASISRPIFSPSMDRAWRKVIQIIILVKSE